MLRIRPINVRTKRLVLDKEHLPEEALQVCDCEHESGNNNIPTITEQDEGKVLMVKKGGAVWEDLPVYEGEYAVTPAVVEQVMNTAQKMMTTNITINPIPYYEVENTGGGDTAYIGKEID